MFNIKIDSRKVKKGDTFVAIVGNNFDGHDFIDTAIKNGATKIIAQHGSYSVETVIVPDVSLYIENYLIKEYKSIIDKMYFIGVTGTNGKTSTAFIIYQMLNELKMKSAYIGTIGYYDGKFCEKLNNTTPTIVELYDLIITSYEKGINYIVMEVSSHALELNRVAGINFDVSGFTNLTQDHLDFHKTMENYLNSKLKIIDISDKMIINNDDLSGTSFCKGKYETIGYSNADYLINSAVVVNNKTSISFTYDNKNYDVETNLLGNFNVYNYMLALAICSNYKSIKDIIDITKNVYPPNGRCDVLMMDDVKVVIDYAHTPDAVEKIINTFKEKDKGKLITVIGCGGNRDPLKRPIMGKLSSDLSDFCIFTNDNPRFENEKNIMKDILSGVDKDNYEVIYDRKKAIKKALKISNGFDAVLILGKGHEDYQIVGNVKHYLCDKDEVLKYIS